MRYIYIIIFIVLYSSTIYSQHVSLLNTHTDAYKNVVGVKTNLGIGSTDVSWEFTKKLLQGGFLTTEIKDRAFNQLSELNSGGGLWTTELFFAKQKSRFLGIKSCDWRIRIQHIEYADAQFSKDYFGLVFFGNKKYEEQSAQLTQLNYNYLSYSTLESGFIKSFNNVRFGVDLGLAIGHKSIEVIGKKGSVFTAKDGEYVDVDLDFTSSVTPNPFKAKSIDGLGMTSNFLLGFNLLNLGWLDFQVNRLGFLQWSNKTIESKLDTTARIEGFEVQNLFDSIYINLKSFEAYQSDFIHKSNQARRDELPLQLGIKCTTLLLNAKLQLIGEVNYLPYSHITASYDVYANLKISPHLSIGGSIGIGGYNDFRFGLATDILLFKSCLIQVYTRSFFWAIQNKNPTSFIVGSTLRKYF